MRLSITEWLILGGGAFVFGGIIGYVSSKIWGTQKMPFWWSFIFICALFMIMFGVDYTINIIPLLVCFVVGFCMSADAQYEKENKE